MTQVVLSKLNLTRGTTPILRDVDLTVDDGEFCVFVGPSGCGKSTLLRLIAGLDNDASGVIRIGGQDVAKVPAAQRNVAMVFQGYALYPHMSVRDNMAFALKRAGRPKAEIEQRVNEAARILQLEALLDRPPGKLSGGQRQRVAIGRAIVKQPKVFLFDEPLSNLDAGLRVETRVEIAKLHRDVGTASMLYVTHDQVEAMTLANKIVLLQPCGSAGQSNVVQIGRPLDLYHRPNSLFAARFIGTPAMNLLPATVAISGAGLTLNVLGNRVQPQVQGQGLAAGDTVTVGVRAEHLRLGAGAGSSRGRCRHIDELGEHAYLFLTLKGGGEIVIKSEGERARVGDLVEFILPAEQMHVFDRNGKALTRQ
jgi:multiple sugar transport system ATP-binding protein